MTVFALLYQDLCGACTLPARLRGHGQALSHILAQVNINMSGCVMEKRSLSRQDCVVGSRAAARPWHQECATAQYKRYSHCTMYGKNNPA